MPVSSDTVLSIARPVAMGYLWTVLGRVNAVVAAQYAHPDVRGRRIPLQSTRIRAFKALFARERTEGKSILASVTCGAAHAVALQIVTPMAVCRAQRLYKPSAIAHIAPYVSRWLGSRLAAGQLDSVTSILAEAAIMPIYYPLQLTLDTIYLDFGLESQYPSFPQVPIRALLSGLPSDAERRGIILDLPLTIVRAVQRLWLGLPLAAARSTLKSLLQMFLESSPLLSYIPAGPWRTAAIRLIAELTTLPLETLRLRLICDTMVGNSRLYHGSIFKVLTTTLREEGFFGLYGNKSTVKLLFYRYLGLPVFQTGRALIAARSSSSSSS